MAVSDAGGGLDRRRGAFFWLPRRKSAPVWGFRRTPVLLQENRKSDRGVTPQESGDGQETPAATGILDNDFLDAAYPDPVVRPAAAYTYENMAADIQKLKERYGDRMQVQVIGTSLDGREIYDLIVGNPAAPVQVLIQGGIHAREHMTPLLMMKQLETALVYYDTGHYGGRALSDLFQKAALHFVPMTNPDGVTLAQSGLSGIRSGTLQEAIQAAYETDKAEGRTGQPAGERI